MSLVSQIRYYSDPRNEAERAAIARAGLEHLRRNVTPDHGVRLVRRLAQEALERATIKAAAAMRAVVASASGSSSDGEGGEGGEGSHSEGGQGVQKGQKRQEGQEGRSESRSEGGKEGQYRPEGQERQSDGASSTLTLLTSIPDSTPAFIRDPPLQFAFHHPRFKLDGSTAMILYLRDLGTNHLAAAATFCEALGDERRPPRCVERVQRDVSSALGCADAWCLPPDTDRLAFVGDTVTSNTVVTNGVHTYPHLAMFSVVAPCDLVFPSFSRSGVEHNVSSSAAAAACAAASVGGGNSRSDECVVQARTGAGGDGSGGGGDDVRGGRGGGGGKSGGGGGRQHRLVVSAVTNATIAATCRTNGVGPRTCRNLTEHFATRCAVLERSRMRRGKAAATMETEARAGPRTRTGKGTGKGTGTRAGYTYIPEKENQMADPETLPFGGLRVGLDLLTMPVVLRRAVVPIAVSMGGVSTGMLEFDGTSETVDAFCARKGMEEGNCEVLRVYAWGQFSQVE